MVIAVADRDLAGMQKVAQDAVKEYVRSRLPDFDADKLFLNCPHTHTGPGLADVYAEYDVSKDPGVWTTTQYREFFVQRVGDAAVKATHPFELFLDYGVRIKGRSPGTLTLLVQLCGQNTGYLPTDKAVQGGHYSADKFVVGPDGGQILVDETVRLIQQMWQE